MKKIKKRVKKNLFLPVLILILLFMVAIISGVFYFSLVVGDSGTGHIIFKGKLISNNFSESGLDNPIIETNSISNKIKDTDKLKLLNNKVTR